MSDTPDSKDMRDLDAFFREVSRPLKPALDMSDRARMQMHCILETGKSANELTMLERARVRARYLRRVTLPPEDRIESLANRRFITHGDELGRR